MIRLWVPIVGLSAVACASAAGLPSFAGAATCGKCHANVSHTWSASRHSKMVQPATTTAWWAISRAEQSLCAVAYTVSAQQAGAFYITESYLTGNPQEHRIQYTLGTAASSITSPLSPTVAS
ncbi:MAG: hypothetical protein WDO73_03875 [Ignavibacteriota bacterium]